jgi:hypothetical protein
MVTSEQRDEMRRMRAEMGEMMRNMMQSEAPPRR